MCLNVILPVHCLAADDCSAWIDRHCSMKTQSAVYSGVQELESIETPEVVDFRKHMREVCERIVRDRDNQVCTCKFRKITVL